MTVSFLHLGKVGRLGNSLFQLAATVGYAHARGEQPSFNSDWIHRPYFSVPDEFYTDEEGIPAQSLATHLDERCRVYLQDYSLFRDVMPVIREYLSPSPRALKELEKQQEFWSLPRPIIGLHVRRGDNAYDPETPDKYLYHPLRPLSYYWDALDRFPVDMPVAVFSDDPDWSAAHFYKRACYIHHGVVRPKEHQPEYATAPVLDFIDFFMLASTTHHICSNSTYSLWAALLSGDPYAIVPMPWFGPNLSYIEPRRMFVDSWIQLQHESGTNAHTVQ